jgi:hypothetical protein
MNTARDLLVVRPDGTHDYIENNYEAIRDAIGGWIEFTVISDPVPMAPEGIGVYVDEEGILKDRALNVPVSIMAGRPLVGPAVICSAATGPEGETLIPTAPVARWIMNLADRWHAVITNDLVAIIPPRVMEVHFDE